MLSRIFREKNINIRELEKKLSRDPRSCHPRLSTLKTLTRTFWITPTSQPTTGAERKEMTLSLHVVQDPDFDGDDDPATKSKTVPLSACSALPIWLPLPAWPRATLEWLPAMGWNPPRAKIIEKMMVTATFNKFSTCFPWGLLFFPNPQRLRPVAAIR